MFQSGPHYRTRRCRPARRSTRRGRHAWFTTSVELLVSFALFALVLSNLVGR
jgi:hypothetical protein